MLPHGPQNNAGHKCDSHQALGNTGEVLSTTHEVRVYPALPAGPRVLQPSANTCTLMGFSCTASRRS